MEFTPILITNDGVRQQLEGVNRPEVEFFNVNASDGVSLECWMMKPTDFDPNKKYPVLFYVYGEPAGQTVVDRWGGNRYLWHTLLTQQGYIVMSIENRGTPGPKGREWRKSVYGQIGVQSSKDQSDGAKAIIEQFDFVDEERIGIWGWSGGGAMTLNMMFRYPDIYKTGMSVAPVTNQLLYDNIYQERYSGVPQLMPESYEKGSAINFAQNLKGNLLLVHGTGDDNVHYQHIEQLVNVLIENNKIFSMMAYPNRTHGIRGGENTSRHLREILTRYLNDNLPSGPREWKLNDQN
jgi:dipeptidyl-peptidase-4